MSVIKLKIKVFICFVCLCLIGFSLFTTTYAWFVSNTTVNATGTKISATTNSFILQIANKKDGIATGGNDTSLVASSVGNEISPASTNNIFDWSVCQSFDSQALATSYSKISNDEKGKYLLNGEKYAFAVSEYILYTLPHTGEADVYLNVTDGFPIEVTSLTATNSIVKDSMRIAITVVEENGEELKVVYAPSAVAGKGNDKNAIEDKWTYADESGVSVVTYNHIEFDNYIDQNGYNWGVRLNGNEYITPDGIPNKKITTVGSEGKIVKVYVWLEGTDADCVNNDAIQEHALYDVVVKFAGIKV